MAVTITATAASTTANSYATLAEANSYLAERGDGAAAWTALDDDSKARKLIQATRFVDRYNFDSYPYDTSTQVAGRQNGQALKFPRIEDEDYQGNAYVPAAVKYATCEIALLLCMARESAMIGGTGVRSATIGSVSVTISDAEAQADQIVRQWLGDRLAASVEME